MRIGRAFSIDNLQYKIQFKYQERPKIPETVSVLSVLFPVLIFSGFIYFDSAVHKLFVEHWRNGLGGWLPSFYALLCFSTRSSPGCLNNEVLK